MIENIQTFKIIDQNSSLSYLSSLLFYFEYEEDTFKG